MSTLSSDQLPILAGALLRLRCLIFLNVRGVLLRADGCGTGLHVRHIFRSVLHCAPGFVLGLRFCVQGRAFLGKFGLLFRDGLTLGFDRAPAIV